MFEALVQRLLNKILGEYIQNFSAQNLKIGIWSGEVVLKNIILKKSIIKKLNLPFRINYSRLGCLKMNIPWKSLTSSKIEVVLEGLELVISEIPINEWDCKNNKIIQQRKKEIQALCESVLEDFAKKGDKSKDKGQDGYFSKLVVKIIDNLQVTVKDIHIRYEDQNTKLFSFGITLEEFKLYTVNTKGQPEYIDRSKPQYCNQPLRKKLELYNIGVYWNQSSEFYTEANYQSKMGSTIAKRGNTAYSHNYLILMTSQAQLLQREPGKQFAQAEIDLQIALEDIKVQITNTQLQQIITLGERLQGYTRKLKDQNRVKLTQEEMRSNCTFFNQIFPKYYDGWGKCLSKEEMERLQHILQKMQVQNFVKDITKFFQDKQRERIIKQRKEKNKGWWFGQPKELTPQQLSQIQSYLNNNFSTQVSIVKRPEDYYYIKVGFKLNKFEICIANTMSIVKEGIQSITEDLQINFYLRQGGYNLELTLQSISVNMFRQIGVEPRQTKQILYRMNERTSKLDNSYLKMSVTGNPLSKKHLNTDIKLTTSQLMLVFDPKIISIAVDFADLKFSTQNKEAAIQKFGEIKEATTAAVSESIQKPTKLKIGVDVTISSINVVLPFSPHRQNEDCWGVNLGSIRFTTDQQTLLRSGTDQHFPLDVFNMALTSFSFRHYPSPSQLTRMLVTGCPYQNLAHAVLNNLDFKLRVQMFSKATDSQAKIRVHAILPSFQVNLNDFTYKSVLKVADAFEMEEKIQKSRITVRIEEKKEIQKRSSKIGFVYIKSSITKIWEKYVAIMSENYIYLYLNKNDKNYYAYYYIKGAQLEKFTDPLDKEKPFLFRIKNKVNEVVFGFDKEEQIEDWQVKINALNKEQEMAASLINMTVANILQTFAPPKQHNQLNLQLNAEIESVGIKVFTTQSLNDQVISLVFRRLTTRVFIHQSKKKIQLKLFSIELKDTMRQYKSKQLAYFVQSKHAQNEEDLISIQVQQLNKDHPDFDHTDSSITVKFGTLACNYKCETVKALMSFFIPPPAPPQLQAQPHSAQFDLTSTVVVVPQYSNGQQNYSLKLRLKIEEISLTLVNQKTKTVLGTLGIANLNLYMGISQKRMVLQGSQKDLYYIDTTNHPNTIYTQQQQYNNKKYILTANIGSQKNMLQFNIQILKNINEYGKNMLIDIQLANLTTYFSLQPVLRLITYLNTQLLPSFQTAPKQNAPVQTKDAKPQPATMDLKVQLSNISVYIETEKQEKQNQEYMQLNIAAITVRNESSYRDYIKGPDKKPIILVQNYIVNLYALSIAVHYFDSNNKKHRYKLTNNMDISLSTDLIANPDYYKKQIPDQFDNGMRVSCSMTPFFMTINHDDYSFIMKCLNWAITYNDGLDSDLFDLPNNAPPQQQANIQSKQNQPAKDPFYLSLRMDCISLFITQQGIPIAFLQQTNLAVSFSMQEQTMNLQLTMDQLYGTSILHNKQEGTLTQRGIFNSLGYAAKHSVQEIRDMQSYIKLFDRRQNIAHTKNFLVFSLTMTPSSMSMQININEISIDVDIRLLLILSTLANTDETYIKGPPPIKSIINAEDSMKEEVARPVAAAPAKKMTIKFTLGKFVSSVCDASRQKFFMVQGEVTLSMTSQGDKSIDQIQQIYKERDITSSIPHSSITASLKNLTVYFSRIKDGRIIARRNFLQPIAFDFDQKRFYHMQKEVHILTTDIRAEVSDVVLTASLKDMLNINKIAQDSLTILAQFQTQSKPKSEPKLQGDVDIEEELHKIEEKIVREVQSKTKIMGEVGPMQIEVINDCGRNFMPVVRVMVQGTEPAMQQSILSTQIFVVPIFSIYFFNPRSSRWQPIIQPFKASINLTTITLNKEQSTSIVLKTAGLEEETSSMKINFSTQMLSTLLAAKQVLTAEKDNLDKGEAQEENIQISPFIFQNLTNEKIYIIRGENELLLNPLFKGPVRLADDSEIRFRLKGKTAKISTDHYGVIRIPQTVYFIKFDTEKLNKVIKFMPPLIIRNKLRQAIYVKRVGNNDETPVKVQKRQAIPLDGIDFFAVSLNGSSYTQQMKVTAVKMVGFMMAEKKNFVILLKYKEKLGRFAVLELLPPFVVYNCLPKALNLQFIQKAKLKSTVNVAPQQSYSIFTAQDVRSLEVKATVQGFTWSKKFKYRQDQQGEGQIQLGDQDNHLTVLNYRFAKQNSQQFVLTIYCRKFIVNELGDKLIVYGNLQADEKEHRKDNFRLLGGQRKEDETFDEKVILVGEEVGNKLRVCGAHSQFDFATPIMVGGIGSSQARIVVDRLHEGHKESLFSVIDVEISAVRMAKQCDVFSKKIVLRSKAIFVNSTQKDVNISEEATTSHSFLSPAGSRKSLVFAMPEITGQLQRYTISAKDFFASRPITLPTQGSIHFELQSKEQDKESAYFKIHVKQAECYSFYELTEIVSDDLPYEVVVRSASLRVRVPALGKTLTKGDVCRFINKEEQDPYNVELIVGHCDSKQEIKVSVCPDNLQFKQKELLRIFRGGLEGSIPVVVQVTLKDKQRAIIIDELVRVEQPKELQQSAISVQLAQIVFSINQNSQSVEVPYESLVITLRRLQLIKLQTDKRVQYQAKLGFLQIDQAYPHVIASPVILTPYKYLQFTREKQPKAVFNFTVVLSKQFVKNTFIKEISIDLNDLVATFSADFLTLVTTVSAQFAQVVNYKEESYLIERKEEAWQQLAIPQEGKSVFIRCIRIAPFVVDLSAQLNLKKLNLQNNVLLTTVLSTIGVVVSNIDSAPIEMTGIEIDDCNDTVDSITRRLVSHYRSTCVAQFYKIVGSLNIIGNPLSLFRNISTGVKDLKEKPAKGFVNGPAQFGIGIVEGTTSLVAHSVGGAFNSIAKVTGTVSTGLATLAFDRQFEEHREKEKMKKPQNVIQGVAKGGKAIFYGFKQGITGVFTQPLENARKQGALGFVKGAAKGLAGLVVKPVTGIIDFAAKTTEGIKNNALMFEDKSHEQRMRYPRVFYSECFILKEYSLRDSQLFAILKKVDNENKCPNPVFVDAYQADSGRHFLILLLSGVAFLDAQARKLKWAIDFSEMELENTGKRLVFRKGGKMGSFFHNYDVEIQSDEIRGIVADLILALQKDRINQ